MALIDSYSSGANQWHKYFKILGQRQIGDVSPWYVMILTLYQLEIILAHEMTTRRIAAQMQKARQNL